MEPRRKGEHQSEAPGGILSSPDIETAAYLDSLGLDGGLYLDSADSAQRITLLARARKLESLRDLERKNLAIEMVNALSRALKG